MSAELVKALRFRAYAEELRVIAADRASEEHRRTLLELAVQYEQLAASMESIKPTKRYAALDIDDGERQAVDAIVAIQCRSVEPPKWFRTC